jgi:tetrahydromethanopterin S-methyltransferase subunit B
MKDLTQDPVQRMDEIVKQLTDLYGEADKLLDAMSSASARTPAFPATFATTLGSWRARDDMATAAGAHFRRP